MKTSRSLYPFSSRAINLALAIIFSTMLATPALFASDDHLDHYGNSDDYDSDEIATVKGSHCNLIVFSVAPGSAIGDSLTYGATHTGHGSVSVDSAGTVTYTPTPEDVYQRVIVTVTSYLNGEEYAVTNTRVKVTNNRPKAICYHKRFSIAAGFSLTTPPLRVADPDPCDGAIWEITSIKPEPIGELSIDPQLGAITFAPDSADLRGRKKTKFHVRVKVFDGIDSDFCNLTFTALKSDRHIVRISQTDFDENGDRVWGTLPGGIAEISLVYDYGTEPVSGFNFALVFKPSELEPLTVDPGAIFSTHGWQDFAYEIDTTGVLRLSGGPSGESATDGARLRPDDTLAVIRFQVAEECELTRSFLPVRWYWTNCDDNTFNSPESQDRVISRRVFDYIGTGSDPLMLGRHRIDEKKSELPTIYGAPRHCVSHDDSPGLISSLFDDDDDEHDGEHGGKYDDESEDEDSDDDNDGPEEAGNHPRRYIDLLNGGVNVIFDGCVDPRGDINLNGLAFENADAVMFSDYFVIGETAFGGHVEGSTLASEINYDGIPLGIDDFVYMLRTISGDYKPVEELHGDTVTFTQMNDTVSVDDELGAAVLVFSGIVNVELLQNNMVLKTGVQNGDTYALIWNLGTERIHPGPLVSASDGALINALSANYDGAMMVSNIISDFPTDVGDVENGVLPGNFLLYDNYPNPFNPSTTIKIDFPRRSAYRLAIYNIAGQLVKEFTGEHSVGTLSVEWNAQGVSSGVYLYKFNAEGFSASKKMTLLK